MKAKLFALLFGVALVANVCRAAVVPELERAIRELPAQFVADIPLAQRTALLQSLRSDPSDTRLDLAHGYLHFYSDGGDHGAVGGSSMLYMRQFQRTDGGFVVLTHMPKPFADANATLKANQTFFFERRNGKWTDITAEVLPAGVDMRNHFSPRRASNIIDVAPYKRTLSYQGKPRWEFGAPALELRWNRSVFRKHKATTRTLSDE